MHTIKHIHPHSLMFSNNYCLSSQLPIPFSQSLNHLFTSSDSNSPTHPPLLDGAIVSSLLPFFLPQFFLSSGFRPAAHAQPADVDYSPNIQAIISSASRPFVFVCCCWLVHFRCIQPPPPPPLSSAAADIDSTPPRRRGSFSSLFFHFLPFFIRSSPDHPPVQSPSASAQFPADSDFFS